ncbi:hypothetical protein [Streptosporangium amethystogenes]|uniref:hypothetical protein n=1 Tax=Streptosporangium amethystogenes TaxID=2002 RepID=UPI0004CC01A3|nr:hypothetical protein [Streptosporangium amethystogenes]
MAISLCIPPRQGELCAPVRFDLTGEHTFLELTSRHRVTKVEQDEVKGTVAVWVDITDPETSRPVHVRFSVLPLGDEISPRSRLLGEIERDGERLGVYGTYLGVVSEEN